MAGSPDLSGPDLAAGIALDELADGAMLQGHAGGEAVLLARRGDAFLAVGAHCTHYHGPLVDGIVVGDTVRCPWHHACFSLRTGEALRAPALSPIPCWRVERRDGKVFVREKIKPARPDRDVRPQGVDTVVILGGGAAGSAAAETLRREGYSGRVRIISADSSPPYDRPNLSKDYLAGKAPEDWIPLRSEKFYAKQDIELLLDTRVTAIHTGRRQLTLSDGGTCGYDALILATGAEPVRLEVPGAANPLVHYLRTLADCRALIDAASRAQRAVVIGASFIGMEVAAALRTRGLEVRVVAPDSRPMERILGPEIGDYIRALHEKRGVRFHLERKVAAIDERRVILQGGEVIDADLIVVGIGVRPVTDIAEAAGIEVDRGVLVNAHLETSALGVFAAGDIARWPDPLTGHRIRVEHWVVAQRQGQTAARNILGRGERFALPPFFWTQQYETSINYVGHAERWDRIAVDGRIEDGDCQVSYQRDGKTCAIATIGRDRASLECEVAMERTVAPD